MVFKTYLHKWPFLRRISSGYHGFSGNLGSWWSYGNCHEQHSFKWPRRTRPRHDRAGRGQNIEADNLGLGGGVESSNTFDLKDTSEEEVIEEFHRFEQEEIRNSSFCQEGRMSSECCWYWNLGFDPNCNWWRNRHGWRNRSCYRKSWCSWWKVQDQVTEPSKIGEGSRSRVKVYLLNDYPTEVINSSKLPLGKSCWTSSSIYWKTQIKPSIQILILLNSFLFSESICGIWQTDLSLSHYLIPQVTEMEMGQGLWKSR